MISGCKRMFDNQISNATWIASHVGSIRGYAPRRMKHNNEVGRKREEVDRQADDGLLLFSWENGWNTYLGGKSPNWYASHEPLIHHGVCISTICCGFE